jgi:hypothetical protein
MSLEDARWPGSAFESGEVLHPLFLALAQPLTQTRALGAVTFSWPGHQALASRAGWRW